MILNNISSTLGPGMWGILYCATLWFFGMLVMLYHRSGLQVIGSVIVCIGFLVLLTNSQILLSLCLLVFGFFVHSCGRLLMHLRRRG